MDIRRYYGTQLLVGILLMFVGTALLLEHQSLIFPVSLWRYWPLLVVAWGMIKLIGAQTRAEQGSGLGFILIGFWLATSILHWWGLSFSETWPAVLIAFGVSTLWKGLPPMDSPQSYQE